MADIALVPKIYHAITEASQDVQVCMFARAKERQMTKRISLVILALVAMTGLAEAHPDHGNAIGFAHGFAHPLGGWDHIIAMIAVGFFAARLGGKARFAVPATFVAMMAAGGAWGLAGLALPFVEIGILTSVVVLSGVAVLRWNASLYAAMALAGFFAVFHGYAHGMEMPQDAAGLTYALGFMLATGLLHIAGLALGSFLTKSKAVPQS
jgi:urease accessory protein